MHEIVLESAALLLALYIRNYTSALGKGRTLPLPLFALPLILGAALLILNLFTGFCFFPGEDGQILRGSGNWLLFLLSLVYQLTALGAVLRAKGLSRVDRAAMPLLIAVSFLGTLVRAIWAIPVELFFTATAVFGLMALLELEDITCEWAQNGQIAVDLLVGSEPGHFDAVLKDMRMPVMDGLTATREIRKLDHPDAGTIPIIALTANAFEEDVQQCLQAGMNGHIAKPVDTELLLKTLGRLIAAREKGE